MTAELLVSGLLLCAILAFEGWRRATRQSLDLLSVANLAFALNYCIPPFFIALIGGTALENGPTGQPLYLFPLIEKIQLDDGAYAKAAWMAALAYGAMIFAYAFIKPKAARRIAPLDSNQIMAGPAPSRWVLAFGLALGAIAVVSLFLYSAQFNEFGRFLKHDPNAPIYLSDPTGLLMMLNLGAYVRGDWIAPSLGYLQILVLLGIPAVMLLGAVAIQAKGASRWFLVGLATVIWLAVLARVYHAAGRMEFMTFVAIFPLAALFSIRSRAVMGFGAAGLLSVALFVGILGKEFFQQPLKNLAQISDVIVLKAGQSVLFLLNEFGFPHVISAHTLQIVPSVVDHRYFVDLPLSLLYVLPSFGGSDSWPPLLSHIHAEILPLMPIDLVSFGYFAMGLAGVVLVFLVLGAAMAVMDVWLTPGAGWLAQCLRAGWMMFLPFRIMYADPYTSMKTAFGLIVGTVVVLLLTWMARRWRTA